MGQPTVSQRCIAPGQQLYRIVADEFIIVDFLGGTTDEARSCIRKSVFEIDRFIEQNHYRDSLYHFQQVC